MYVCAWFKGVADVCVCSHNEFGYVLSIANHSHQVVLFVFTLFYNCVSQQLHYFVDDVLSLCTL